MLAGGLVTRDLLTRILYLISFVWQGRRGATIDLRSAAAAAAIAASCGPAPVHITDRLGGPAVAMYRSPDGHMTFVLAPRGQPGGIDRVVNYIGQPRPSAGAIGRLCIGCRPCRSALTGRRLAALLVNTHEQNCPQHGTDAGTVRRWAPLGGDSPESKQQGSSSSGCRAGGGPDPGIILQAGNNFIVVIFKTIRTFFESIVAQ